MQCVGPPVQADENMNGAGEQVDILPPNCMVKDRWKVVSEFSYQELFRVGYFASLLKMIGVFKPCPIQLVVQIKL